jgi:alkanesulfonate monooxygenase SsuD/methylene tetrahydromethanopterin reductase-like flavin-dependent oxidoreductase (luciferase family)
MAERLSMGNDNELKIGLFAANCSSGRAATKVPERWSGSWDDNLKLLRLADEAGIDFMLPIGRWKGYRGETNFHGAVLETITWAGALLAHSERITVFGTVHAPLLHPVFAAKQFATLDIVGRGRFGLNMVAGWNTDEFRMFGAPPLSHDDRYAYAREWVEIIKLLWERTGEFDYHGTYFQLEGLYAEPKPYGGSRPIIMNAGASPEGRAFAIDVSDMLFCSLVTLEQGASAVRTVQQQSAAVGRRVNVFTSSYTVCRPNRKEAEDYHRYYVDECGDWDAYEHLVELQFPNPEQRAQRDALETRRRFIGGNGSFPLIGSPDDIAEKLREIHACGFNGIATSFVNYLDEFPYFRDEVLPRLERLGLRSGRRPVAVTSPVR